MKKIFAIALMTAVLSACDTTNEPLVTEGLLGTWELVETLADPGDGSGTYQPIDSDKTLQFHWDGTFNANISMCSAFGNSTTDLATGTYDLGDSTLTLLHCPMQGTDELRKLGFELRGENLFILYPCIEPCGEKYVKVKKD